MPLKGWSRGGGIGHTIFRVRFARVAAIIRVMNEEAGLLRRFADEGAQDALAELVRRKLDLGFNAALRQTGGDTHLAQDVAQMVFVARRRTDPRRCAW